MPPGRPPKRPSDAAEGVAPSDSPPPAPKLKQARIDRGPEEFSNVVKNKLQSYTRTGQACDRCKVRKIRCDALPEGCSHCTNQNLECYVTDRVTGRTERRGYMQQLEREKTGMLNHIRDLEKLLLSSGIEVRPWEWSPYGLECPPGVSFDNMGNPMQDPNAKDQWTQFGTLWVKNFGNKSQYFPTGYSAGQYSRLSLLETRPTEGYLGVLMDSAPLSSIKGTKLSILGTTIDITSFDAPDMDEPVPGTPIGSPLYNKSLMAFLQSTLGVNPKLDDVDLPSKHDAFTYSEWYFLMIHPFMPVLHKPSFLKLLTRIYDEPGFKPTTCELVTAHMVFATIYFQYGVRNREESAKYSQLNDLSNKHYHWSLSKFFNLASENTVTAVQALSMIVIHTRSFPKPGCSSVIANYALSRAIELGLHRGLKLPNGGTNIDNEVRKRVWWATLALAVTLNGRLGRPMPITLEEFDVELPLAIPDECLTDEGISDPSQIGQCAFLVGLTSFKVVPLYMEMWSNIYSVRRNPGKYVEVVRALEESMHALQNSLPDELKPDKCHSNSRIFALYTEAMTLEFYLCLRHPSVCMTQDREFCAENTRICEATAGKLLEVVTGLLKIKSLDTTWYQLAVYVAAIFSSLVGHWERRFDTTPTEIARLRGEMKMWMNVVYEIGLTLGPGAKLSEEIGMTIDRTITMIEHDMNRKGTGQPDQPAAPHQPAPQLQQDLSAPAREQVTSVSGPEDFSSNEQHRNGAASDNGYYNSGIASHATGGYGASVAYASQAITGGQVSGSNGMTGVGPYDAAESAQYLYAAGATTNPGSGMDQSASSTNPLIAFASQATAQVSAAQPGGETDGWRQPQASLAAAAHGTNGWHDWTAAIADSQTDRYSANALLTLGAGRPSDGNSAAGLGGGVSVTADMGMVGPSGSVTQPGQWPLLLFDGNGTVNGS
ncbi:hypothetical protein CONLIGDRAFT_637011 [Coniochaeta ligniaria NRRL 30616]|uniref:Zn(2)-C6 fungal-type domain-containing protein n=1 Tax=Coniochaeta ligniaria NRRL 30616 TaxID=1408157 RepID=A0A1J7J8C7_9PEZI|nr:hypothetical protein CONLIGDRAFT_637011 [Coniochaeta ligniaria NRRL 30616]